MYLIDSAAHNRRAFLRRSGQLAMAGTALPFALNLAAMGEAAAQAAPGGDYRALVCIFLLGGNDYANTVVSYDQPSHATYLAVRGAQSSGGLALARPALEATLLAPTSALPEGRQYALNPAMTELASLFAAGSAAVQLNVGSLVAPLTRAQFFHSNKKLYPLPAKLFSHNDQQSTWQSFAPEGSSVGWGGKLGDLVLRQNTQSLFTCMSVSGNAVFLAGDSALQYRLSSRGAVKINGISGGGNGYATAAVRSALAQLAQAPRTHVLENEYTRVTKRAVEAEGAITSAIGTGFDPNVFPATSLGNQLAMVARLVRGRGALGIKRQVFFVAMNGFDLHDGLAGQQPVLMKQLSDAMAAFHRQMTAQGLGDKVTSFTASEFGRALASNGDGSDHGWGGHHFVVGGAVKGKQIYGALPVVSINNDPRLAGYEGHVGQGRLIPSTSVDQYAATLATWFGVPEAELPGILPNLKNFGGSANGIAYPKNVGFMV